jgi:archaemetzincin
MRVKVIGCLAALAGLAVVVMLAGADKKPPASGPASVPTSGAASSPALGPANSPADMERIRQVAKALEPLQEPLGKPKEGDWLYTHKESGQSYGEYRKSDPVLPTAQRRTIYIQPLGKFTDKQREVVTLAADFIGRFYQLPVKVEKDLSLDLVPARARRKHPTWGDSQILSTYVLDELLKPRLPKDAFAYIAFTSSDLWPGDGWNFVFGQASLRDRVGVWSIYRFGDPDKGKDEFRLCLRRTVSTGVHELGHMFSMDHCIYNRCVMCGSNSLTESDAAPLALCTVCLGKVLWATGMKAQDHLGQLEEFCRKQGLDDDAKCFRAQLDALRKTTSSPAGAPTSAGA